MEWMRWLTTRMVTRIVVACGGAAWAQSGVSPMAAGVSPAHAPVVLVELFTSEGCSSCPPADALLQRINQHRTRSGPLVVGLSEHVTY